MLMMMMRLRRRERRRNPEVVNKEIKERSFFISSIDIGFVEVKLATLVMFISSLVEMLEVSSSSSILNALLLFYYSI